MPQHIQFQRLTAIFALAVGCTVGCTATSSVPFSVSPANRLSEYAARMRKTVPSPQALPTELQKEPLTTYIVESGDVLRTEMADLDSPVRLPADQTVLLDGRIDLGQYGRLLVVGKSLEEVEKMVNDAVRAKVKDAGQVTVRLVSTESKTFFVLGEVNTPGEYPLTGRESVLNAIVRAGGLTSAADVRKIILSRPTLPCDPRRVLPVCYPAIVQLGDTSTNYQLLPGDRIFVPSRSFLSALFDSSRTHSKCDPCTRPQRAAPAIQLECPIEIDGPFCEEPAGIGLRGILSGKRCNHCP